MLQNISDYSVKMKPWKDYTPNNLMPYKLNICEAHDLSQSFPPIDSSAWIMVDLTHNYHHVM